MEDLKQSDVAQLRPSQHLMVDSAPSPLVSVSLPIKVTLHHTPSSFSLHQKIFRQLHLLCFSGGRMALYCSGCRQLDRPSKAVKTGPIKFPKPVDLTKALQQCQIQQNRPAWMTKILSHSLHPCRMTELCKWVRDVICAS